MDGRGKNGLEQRLVEGKWLSGPLLETALEEAERSGHSVWFCLIKLRFLTQEELMKFFACESGVPFVRVQDYAQNAELMDLLDHEFCVQNILLPLFRVGKTLFVACSNPFDAGIADAVSRMSGMNAELLIASPDAIRAVQDSWWNLDEKMFRAEEFITRSHKRLYGVSLCRKAERIALKIPLHLTVKGEEVAFNSPALEGASTDISGDVSAAGIESSHYLPPGLVVQVGFKTPGGTVEAEAEVVNCRMERNGRYLSGIVLKGLSEEQKKKILMTL
ncbi:MAG: PilZ domain-containing protein [Deltaproteobacteria bacterium]